MNWEKIYVVRILLITFLSLRLKKTVFFNILFFQNFDIFKEMWKFWLYLKKKSTSKREQKQINISLLYIIFSLNK